MTVSKFLYGHSRSELRRHTYVRLPIRAKSSWSFLAKRHRINTDRCFFCFFFVVPNVGSPERTPSPMMKHLMRCLTTTQHTNTNLANKCRQSSRLLSSTQRQNEGNQTFVSRHHFSNVPPLNPLSKPWNSSPGRPSFTRYAWPWLLCFQHVHYPCARRTRPVRFREAQELL